ncbi:MAG: hypothetical protein AB7O45_07235 [Alphaproteobacteria bacterium]
MDPAPDPTRRARDRLDDLRRRPTPLQRSWLARGLQQPGGKLPLFDRDGQPVSPRTVRSCIEQGWAEPWFANPLKPDWLVCKLTAAGRDLFAGAQAAARKPAPASRPSA